MIFLCFRHLIGRDSQGMVYWGSCGLLAHLLPLNRSSPARLMRAAIFVTAVDEAVGLVSNNFSKRGHGAFSAVFQLSSVASALTMCPFSRVCSDSITEVSCHRSSHSTPGLHIPWGDAGTKPGNSHAPCKSHRRTFFITTLHLHHENKFFFFVSNLAQHDLPSASQTTQGRGGKGRRKQAHLAYACSDCPGLFAK